MIRNIDFYSLTQSQFQPNTWISQYRHAYGGGFPTFPRITVMRGFRNVVHQAVQLPLRIDFSLASQGKRSTPFM